MNEMERRRIGMAMREAMQEGQLRKAIRIAEEWRSAGGSDWQITLNLAVCLSREGGNHEPDAIALAKESLSLSQEHPAALMGSAEIANNMGDFEWCLELLKTAEASTNVNSEWEIIQLKTAALARLGCVQKAEQILEIWPESRRDWRWLLAKGDALIQDNQWERAEVFYRDALREQPNNQVANQNLALALLSQKKWDEGWKQYEWRRSNPRRNKKGTPSYLSASWEKIRNGTVVVIGEQGIGDQIMTARYLRGLAEVCNRVIFQPAPRLMQLMARSLPKTIEIRHPQDPIITTNGEIVAIGSGSMPYLCWKKQGFCAPSQQGYLIPDPSKVNWWRERLLDLSSGRPCIGVGWLGGSNGADHRERSLSREDILKLTSNQQIFWIDLQYLPKSWQQKREHSAPGCRQVMEDPGQDLDSTAALIKALDAVITTRQTVAHIAGALGVRGIVLVPKRMEWRYSNEATTWDWYPSMTLSHQCRRDDWAEAINQALEILET